VNFLRGLYEQLGDKSKIQLNKKVVGFRHEKDCVRALCADGTDFEGSVVVGADGIHSKVREEMQKAGEKAGSLLMKRDEQSE